MRLRALVLALALAIASCRSAAPMAVADRLFFGQNIPAGGTVSSADWQQFVETVITPRFPKGLTISEGHGQWLDPRGNLVHERVYIVEIVHEENVEAKIEAIANEYKKRFGQDAVMRLTEHSALRFY